MGRKPNQKINCEIIDWDGKKVLLPDSVLESHLKDSGHNEAYKYINELKNLLISPDNVIRSKKRKNTKIANIKLTGKNHKYLIVVIRYNSFFSRLMGNKNYIVTFFGKNKPKEGKEIWKK